MMSKLLFLPKWLIVLIMCSNINALCGGGGGDKEPEKPPEIAKAIREFYHKDDLVGFNLPPVTVPVIYKSEVKLYFNFIIRLGFDNEQQAEYAYVHRIWLCDRIFTDLFGFFAVMWNDSMEKDITFLPARIEKILNRNLSDRHQIKKVSFVNAQAHYNYDRYLKKLRDKKNQKKVQVMQKQEKKKEKKVMMKQDNKKHANK